MSDISNVVATSALILAPRPGGPVVEPRSEPAAIAKLRKASVDFEAVLITSLWKSMQATGFDKPEEEGVFSSGSNLSEWSIGVVAQALAQRGGLGIGKMIFENLAPALEANQTDESAAEMVGKPLRDTYRLSYQRDNSPVEGSEYVPKP